jgi:hypothetical protein
VIDDLDASLKAMLTGEAQSGTDLKTAAITFAAPDSTWRANTSALVVNAYLCELAEDRQLHSNQRRTRIGNGMVRTELVPKRVRCAYTISAWNRAAAVAGVEQEVKEHQLLSQVLRVLLDNPTIPPGYLQGALAGQAVDPPVIAAELGGPGSSPDFWSGFGTYLRPAITCRVAIAMPVARALEGPAMTTAILRVEGDQTIVIGGMVVDRQTAAAVAGATVRLDEAEQETVTDALGRFRFDGLRAGAYTLMVRAQGYQPGGGPVRVPAPGGLYDVALTR